MLLDAPLYSLCWRLHSYRYSLNVRGRKAQRQTLHTNCTVCFYTQLSPGRAQECWRMALSDHRGISLMPVLHVLEL